MSETMSGPENWLQFYQQQNLSTSQMSDSTIVTTTVTSSSMLNSPIGSGNNSGTNTGHLSPEGRVSKPIRRRSRASRRTPTTLLNTDTSNFRAMVQQFTGGPSAPFASGAHHGAPPNFGFALGTNRQAHHHPAMMLPPTGHGFHLQPQQQLLYPHHQHHQGQQQYMFSLGNNSSNSTHHGQDHALLQRLGSSRPSSNLGSVVSDGFVIEGVGVPSSSQVPPASTVRPSNESRSNSFLF